MSEASLTLYKIQDDLRALLDTEEGMEPDDDQRLAILDEIAQKTKQAISKRDNVIGLLRHLELQIEAAKKEIKRLQNLKESWEAGKERVENYVVHVFDESVPPPKRKRDKKKLEGTIGLLTLAQNPSYVEITDELLLPDKFEDATIAISGDLYAALVEALKVAGKDGLMFQITERTKFKPRLRDIKEAIDRGEDVPGADVVYGADRLVVR